VVRPLEEFQGRFALEQPVLAEVETALAGVQFLLQHVQCGLLETSG
jgi:hypothetical protein